MTLTEAEVFRAIAEVAALRKLCLELEHLPTPRELELLAEFDSFAAGARQPCSDRALARGLERLWREGRYAEIHQLGARVPKPDREAETYFSVAALALGL